MKYQVEHCPNQDMVILHLSKKLAGKEDISLGDRLFETSPEKAPDSIKEILNTDGIVSVKVRDFKVTMEKGRVFDWDDIMPLVISILANIDPSDGMVEKKRTQSGLILEVSIVENQKDMDQEEQEDE